MEMAEIAHGFAGWHLGCCLPRRDRRRNAALWGFGRGRKLGSRFWVWSVQRVVFWRAEWGNKFTIDKVNCHSWWDLKSHPLLHCLAGN